MPEYKQRLCQQTQNTKNQINTKNTNSKKLSKLDYASQNRTLSHFEHTERFLPKTL